MKEYTVFDAWRITFPEDWTSKYVEEEEQFVFYAPDSDLTVRITQFIASGLDGSYLPAEIMEKAYTCSIPNDAKAFATDALRVEGYKEQGFDIRSKNKKCTIFQKCIGYYTDGELLTVNIFGSDSATCEEALNIVQTLTKLSTSGRSDDYIKA